MIVDLVKSKIIQSVQLHGTENNAYIEELRREILVSAEIIQAFRIRTELDIEKAQQSEADYILLDAYDSEIPGGTGKTFDWSLLRQITRPYFLAGGLNKDNVQQAMKQVHPYAIDVSSGVEAEGYKDKVKIAEFMFNCREEARGEEERDDRK